MASRRLQSKDIALILESDIDDYSEDEGKETVQRKKLKYGKCNDHCLHHHCHNNGCSPLDTAHSNWKWQGCPQIYMWAQWHEIH
jgi:hypothetical protein